MSENSKYKNGGKKSKMAEKIGQSGGGKILKHGHYGGGPKFVYPEFTKIAYHPNNIAGERL